MKILDIVNKVHPVIRWIIYLLVFGFTGIVAYQIYIQGQKLVQKYKNRKAVCDDCFTVKIQYETTPLPFQPTEIKYCKKGEKFSSVHVGENITDPIEKEITEEEYKKACLEHKKIKV